MGTDEEGTLARLKAHRRELVDPKIAEHRGRIVKTTGDGMLVEFASVSTLCAAPSTCNTPCRIAMPMSGLAPLRAPPRDGAEGTPARGSTDAPHRPHDDSRSHDITGRR
jgi:class 3 adenylate cyclase